MQLLKYIFIYVYTYVYMNIDKCIEIRYMNCDKNANILSFGKVSLYACCLGTIPSNITKVVNTSYLRDNGLRGC